MSARGRGRFVVLEGPEGAGKSTLAARLASRLAGAGVPWIAVREPGGTPVAEAARRALLEDHPATAVAELFLFLAARADLVAAVIRPALAEGKLVLADRFELSTEAYQAVGRGLDAGFVHAANAAATGGLRPDLTLILDLPDGVGRQRQLAGGKAGDRLDREAEEFHRRVAAFYRAVGGPGVVHLDASRPLDEVAEAAWGAIEKVASHES
ncbi:MAG TPA: dTMP kinase [Gemmatimonadales bacterium]|nr:dTMP kinase [Gemmatimonadales bacterium]